MKALTEKQIEFTNKLITELVGSNLYIDKEKMDLFISGQVTEISVACFNILRIQELDLKITTSFGKIDGDIVSKDDLEAYSELPAD